MHYNKEHSGQDFVRYFCILRKIIALKDFMLYMRYKWKWEIVWTIHMAVRFSDVSLKIAGTYVRIVKN